MKILLKRYEKTQEKKIEELKKDEKVTITVKKDTPNKAISGILKRFSQTSFFNGVLKQFTILYR